MNRKATTMFLTDLLEESLQDRKYYAKEVTLDYGTAHPSWKLYKIIPSRQSSRKRPMNELLFCMLRSKHRN